MGNCSHSRCRHGRGSPFDRRRDYRYVGTHPEWVEFRDSANIPAPMIKFAVKEYAECWLALVYDSRRGLPPGVGFVVDKQSRQVFARRFVDVLATPGMHL